MKIIEMGIFINNSVSNRSALVFTALLPILLYIASSCHSINNSKMSSSATYALRLKPGQDLKKEIQQFVKDKNIQAGWISTTVGSLTHYNIRFANQPEGTMDSGHFEIVSLTGTVSVNGSHIHISVSDSAGKTIGGHLLGGCTIYTTAEIVLGTSNEFIFERKNDGSTAWEELQVVPIKKD